MHCWSLMVLLWEIYHVFFNRAAWVIRYSKSKAVSRWGKSWWGSGIAVAWTGPYANNLLLTPDRRPHQHLITQCLQGRMLFLMPNQQCQSTEGTNPLKRKWWPVAPLRCYSALEKKCCYQRARLSFREHTVFLESLVRTSLNLLCRLPIAIALALSGGVAIRYVYLRFCGRALKAWLTWRNI